jgi:hypothetical protein
MIFRTRAPESQEVFALMAQPLAGDISIFIDA